MKYFAGGKMRDFDPNNPKDIAKLEKLKKKNFVKSEKIINKDKKRRVNKEKYISNDFVNKFLVWVIVTWIATILFMVTALIISNVFKIEYLLIPFYIFLIVSIILTFRYKTLKKQSSIKEITNSGFNIDRTIDFGKLSFLLDFKNKKFMISNNNGLGRTYNFSNVISYEVYEDNESVIKGCVGKSLVGYAFFGPAGAIIGSSAQRSINDYCSSLKLLVRMNDIDNPLLEIVLIDYKMNKSSIVYKQNIKSLQEMVAYMEFMINDKKVEEFSHNSEVVKMEKTKKEQLLELKELLENNLITEDDYNKKKSDILDFRK